MDANSIHEYVVFSLVLTGRLLQPRLERLSRCCLSLRGGHGLVQLPEHRSTISLLPVDEPWRAHVYLTFRLTLLKLHEALAKISVNDATWAVRNGAMCCNAAHHVAT